MYKKEIVQAIIVSSLLLTIFIIAIITFFLQYRNKKIQYIKNTNLLNEEHNAQLLSTQLEMQTQTMQHIGREIHDNVGQKLTLASLYTQQLAYENKAPQINDKIETISNIINESLAELRQLSKSLTDDKINENNIYTLIQQECNKINDLKYCEVVLISSEHQIELSYQTKNILLRIVQEFIQNSIKHANCKNITITLTKSADKIILSLEDNGIGFDKKNIQQKGIGLLNMKKRTEILGGKFELTSKIDIGTNLTIELPH